MSDLGIFELEFGNNIVIFEIIAKFRKIIKIPKLGTKNALFGYFWAGILKNYCHI